MPRKRKAAELPPWASSAAQRTQLSLQRLRVCHILANLHVYSTTCSRGNKVHLVRALLAHADLESVMQKLQVYQVLKHAPLVCVAIALQVVPYAHVNHIMLPTRPQKLPSLDVIAAHRVKQVRLTQGADVGLHGTVRGPCPIRPQRAGDAVDRIHVANVIRQETANALEQVGIR